LRGIQKEDTRVRMTWFQWTVVILGVLGGLLWTYVLVGFLIDLLNCFGVLLGLDNTFLGLTILAVGNALPDALTTISLVKAGQGTMAIAGGYAGQLFGL
jgi:sodium/potassium/calcium exchanger 6